MRAAIKQAGATLTREENNFFTDTYDSSNVLLDSKELRAFYLNDEVAKIQALKDQDY